MSIAKGIAKAAENVIEMQANTMQIFSRNPRGSSYKDYSRAEVDKFQTLRKDHEFGALLAHAPYTMNLASPRPETHEFACTVIQEDTARMDALGVENLVFHPGSHTGIGKEAGIRNIIAGLDQAITGDEKIYVLLETMTGKGTEIGDRFEELKAIREGAAIRSGSVSAWIPVMCLRRAMILYMIWTEYCRNSMTYWDLSI